MDELGPNLIISPASGNINYHNAYEGGYIDHIFNVCKNALRMKKLFEEAGGKADFTDEQLLFAAFHHDLGKLGIKDELHYVPNDSKWHIENRGDVYMRNDNIPYMSLTDRTFFTLNQYGIQYDETEYFGIKLTDGMYDEDNQNFSCSIRIKNQSKYKQKIVNIISEEQNSYFINNKKSFNSKTNKNPPIINSKYISPLKHLKKNKTFFNIINSDLNDKKDIDSSLKNINLNRNSKVDFINLNIVEQAKAFNNEIDKVKHYENNESVIDSLLKRAITNIKKRKKSYFSNNKNDYD